MIVDAFSNAWGQLDEVTRLVVPPGTQIVKPARGGKTFLAWRGNRWVPVHRRSGQRWFWSE